jgi:hypothetical protein
LFGRYFAKVTAGSQKTASHYVVKYASLIV